ncbi:MAG: substrate-binding periplasmic protein [Aeromonas sp.]
MRVWLWLWLLLSIPASIPTWGETIRLYDYHQHPPFNTGAESGLSRELVKYLNQKLGGEPVIELWLVNRARLALKMSDPGFDSMVAWVNPAWMGDPLRERYLWSFPVMRDTNELISNRSHPITYRGPDSLKGLVFGGVEGYRYQGIDDAAARGELERHNAKKVKTNLDLLVRGRIDITLVSGSSLAFFTQAPEYQGKLFVSPFAHSSFTRHLLVPKSRTDLYRRLNRISEQMDRDPSWHAILESYRGNP